MRVLHLMAGGEAGGAETYFTETISALAGAGLEQHAVIRPSEARQAALEKAGVPVTTARFGKWFDFDTKREIQRVIDEFRPGIVQAWMGRAARVLPDGPAINVGWFGGYYDLKRYRQADHFVGCTYDIARHLATEGAPADCVHTIHTFADLDDAPALPRTSFDTPPGVPVLLFLGRLHVKKGVDIALKALAELPDCHLWIAGEGPLRTELEALAATLGVAGRVRFLGWRTDRAALLRAADALLVPSRYEPFGTIMVEAWATDTPLIATAAAGPAAYIEDGKNGLLAPVDDVGAFALAIRRVLADDRLAQTLAEGGRQTYEANFTKPKIVAAWMELYESVCDSSLREPAQPNGL
jgi:glycosyltransferase involved in cell wall biosynthesis